MCKKKVYKLLISKKSTIYLLSLWNLVIIEILWVDFVARISAWSDKSCGFLVFNNSQKLVHFFLTHPLNRTARIYSFIVLLYHVNFDYLGFSNLHNSSFLYLVMSVYCITILFIRIGKIHGHSSSILPILWKDACAP